MLTMKESLQIPGKYLITFPPSVLFVFVLKLIFRVYFLPQGR